jgi:hypothetical protein
MALQAVAYNDSIALDKIHEYFAGSKSERIATTSGTKCRKCGRLFAVILAVKDDVKNSRYLDQLQQMIERDCKKGQHCDEYQLDRV